MRTLTLSLAKEESEHGIELATLNPGLTLTGLTATPLVLAGKEQAQLKGLRTVMPLLGDPASKPAASLVKVRTARRSPETGVLSSAPATPCSKAPADRPAC
ncbi:hypothetical protein BST95_00875 [Halioglobus japonicus]|uniref:hypothetical protein n=1 Tax=Halioglobus japonicus TaxID=930805 RepID=UPI00097914CE|nr:hypothetical protein BST95_00875 [Halioglobus japonicus]GHD21892.1 hypothetical protein GCM10007052_33210 [Halioglobus japonicus]